MNNFVTDIVKLHGNKKYNLLNILLDIREKFGYISDEAIETLSSELCISKVELEETISFYHFFRRKLPGKYQVYLNSNITSEMFGFSAIKKAFEKEAGCEFGQVSSDGLIGLYETSCIGMNDQEPAALINGITFTRLTPLSVKKLVAGFRENKPIDALTDNPYSEDKGSLAYVESLVDNNIKLAGPLLCDNYISGTALKKALLLSKKEVIKEIKDSKLAGRGGAGFSTGLKWELCHNVEHNTKYIFCNADEGEPGTFKDRVLLTKHPLSIFEGMAIAGYAVGAEFGVIYIRDEYRYLKEYLEKSLAEAKKMGLLGKNIFQKQGFNFNIILQYGAGAYVCGEESALIESAEGKRGEPRERPPFPIDKGYLGYPTVVNNVETFVAACRIMEKDAGWWKALGTKTSSGTKLLSISGDCTRPGVYEVEWGITILELLEKCGAKDVQAVQLSGPAGILIGEDMFHRKCCFTDIPAGGSVIIFNKSRDLLKEVVMNFINFFCEESCGSCTTCRFIPSQLRDKLKKILAGRGVQKDITDMLNWSKMLDNSRCGLGKTAANPIVYSIRHFRHLYDNLIQKDKEFDESFDLNKAIIQYCEAVERDPHT